MIRDIIAAFREAVREFKRRRAHRAFIATLRADDGTNPFI